MKTTKKFKLICFVISLAMLFSVSVFALDINNQGFGEIGLLCTKSPALR